jgi:hypothetical protein
MAFPGTPVGIADLFDQRGQMMMLIARAATQRVDFLGQARVLVIAIGDQGFDRLVTDDASDLGEATGWVVVVPKSSTST